MENAKLIKALKAEANCEQFYGQHNNCCGCPMPRKDNPSYQKMCVDFDEEVLPQLADALEEADRRIAELEAAQRWIPVEERLPDDVGSYLVYYHEWSNGDFLPKYDDYRIRVMRFMNNGKWRMPVCTDKRCEADTNREVTHWRKLPRPPQRTRRSLQ